MGSESIETWLSKIVDEEVDNFAKRVDEKIETEQQQMKACKKKTEFETKQAQEMRIHNDLQERLDQLTQRSEQYRMSTTFEHLTITDSDKNRLDNAKKTYQVAKELTNIRWDFSAPANVAKGYIKSEARKLLQPIELDMSRGADSGALWSLLQATVAPGWPFTADKENKPLNEAHK